MADKVEKPVKLTDKTKLVATTAHPYHKEGKEFEIHPVHVDELIEKKWAVKPGGNTKAGKGAATLKKSATPDAENEEVKA